MNTISLLVLLSLLAIDASKVKQKANLNGRAFPQDICPSFTTHSQYIPYDPARYTSGKSPYSIPNQMEITASAQGCPGCQLVHFHLISRHGSRFPTEGNIHSILLFEDKLRMVRNPQYQWMRTWKSPISPANEGKLHQVGWNDLRALGQRDRARHAPLLNMTPHLGHQLDVRATGVERSQQSGVAYLQSIFGINNPMTPRITVYNPSKDPEMRPWAGCPKYKFSKAHPQLTAMKKDRENVFKQRLSHRLSSLLGAPIEPKDIGTLYTLCQTGLSLCNARAQFCSLFTAQEMAKLNYFADMTYYFVHGPGNPLNVKMAGPLIKAIRKELMAAAAKPMAGPRAHLRFNHAETVARLSNALHIYDLPQDPDTTQFAPPNPLAFNQARDIPFAANIHLQLWHGPPLSKAQQQDMHRMAKYHQSQLKQMEALAPKFKLERRSPKHHSKGHAVKKHGNEYYVRMLVNERPRMIRGCGTMFCPLKEFLAMTEKLSQVQLKDICRLTSQQEAEVRKHGDKKKNKEALQQNAEFQHPRFNGGFGQVISGPQPFGQLYGQPAQPGYGQAPDQPAYGQPQFDQQSYGQQPQYNYMNQPTPRSVQLPGHIPHEFQGGLTPPGY